MDNALNDFPENYYGSLRLTFRGSILRGRRFLIYINKASSIASTVYYHGIEVDRQFPIYDDYPALEIDNIFSRSPNSGSILLKGNQRFRFIFTSRIPFDMIRSFEFVSHGDKCIKAGKHCKERNLTKEERRNIFKHLFGLRTALLLQHWGIYEQANQLFLGANFSSVEDGIAHIRALQDLLSNRERQLQNKS